MAGDAFDVITARILEQLEAGTVPWRKPWVGGEAGQPRNLASGHRYRGINVFTLACSPFNSPFWLTFRQAKELGGHVRRGERSTPVVYWNWIEKRDAESGDKKRIPLLRQYAVFNSEQCELPADERPAPLVRLASDFAPLAACEVVVSGMPNPPSIRRGGGVAAYRPAADEIVVPEPERFDAPASFYATLFHEMVHSTGHATRLNRPGITGEIRFGSPTYSKEELVAEMGATFLCGRCGIENAVIENSAAYIAGWLARLRDDKRLVVHAAAAAQKAADFVLNRSQESAGKGEHHDEQ